MTELLIWVSILWLSAIIIVTSLGDTWRHLILGILGIIVWSFSAMKIADLQMDNLQYPMTICVP